MKNSKVVLKAIEMQDKGYTHMASIVKSVFKSKYYHVVKISNIINAGKWIPANKQAYTFKNGNYKHIRIGTNGKNIDWTKTCRK